ncbi:uncharacterized protein LOC104891184 [Beta vulgaris subsp. vulgaris]|uniref:uncharacterized protein LOC104891184 n=1 Tax=Beta vulgaris subsp. vulgaris TaxID=3555 RepID=UPI002036DE15|nr:uncharacterized protein LOC104891184 [Beta vulgaris subsp. vulgaris]
MAGDFGTGVVKPRLVIERNAEGNINLGHEHDTKDSKKACIKVVADATNGLAIAFSNFVNAIEVAKSEFPNFEAIDKLSTLAHSMMEVYKDSNKSIECNVNV